VSTPSIWHKLYNGETNVEFIGRWKLWFALSGLLILVGVGSLTTRGLNLGIEFEGGVSWQVPVGDSDVASMRGVVEGEGLSATVQTVGTGDSERLRIRAQVEDDTDVASISEVIAAEAGVALDEVTVQSVSESWGDEISSKAQRALIIFLLLVTLYITLRFEWKMAAATVLALAHDVLVTVGLYSIFSFEVTPATVVAILTILGFSIYDGIVVFDRIDENAKALAIAGGRTYSRMVNDSMNEVLMRTLNTSITALLPILSLLVLGSLVMGATTLQDFSLALFIGLAAGAYSSIFIASPALALLKEREERWRQMRERVERLDRRAAPPVTAAVETPSAVSAAPPDRGPAPPPSAPPPIQARGRKKQGRRK